MLVSGVLFLAVQFAVVSGRLTVLRGKDLVCVSDDDGAGLTWNSNLKWKKTFQNPNEPRSKSLLNCELNRFPSCIYSWSTEGWNLTSSMQTPMGPVLDRRWEGFKEERDQYVNLFSMQSFVVSMRGPGYGAIHICKITNSLFELCYWILIGDSLNTKSMLAVCPTNTGRLYESGCKNHQYSTHVALSPIEWKTFVVTWNESTRNISVYHGEKMILTLVDSEKSLTEQDTYYILHLYGIPPAQFRLHDYKFLHTTMRYALLASPKLSITTTNFCVEMVVGLCAECQLELTLANPSSKKVEHTLEVIRGFPTVHGLPAWQYVRVNKSISLGNSNVVLRIFTTLKQETSNPLWAVANVRSCPPADSIRKGKMNTTQDYDQSKYYEPNVTCQKLFYNEETVVNVLPPSTTEMKFGDSDCQLGKVGPHCSISCTEDLQLEADCKTATICEETTCTCLSGYTGPCCDERIVRKQSSIIWLAPIVMIILLAVVAFYLYSRKRMKRRTDESPRELLQCTASPRNALPGDGWVRVGPSESKS